MTNTKDNGGPAPDANGWYPIESAPKDGTDILVWDEVFVIAYWEDWNCQWYSEHGPVIFQKWKPLGPPPVGAE